MGPLDKEGYNRRKENKLEPCRGGEEMFISRRMVVLSMSSRLGFVVITFIFEN